MGLFNFFRPAPQQVVIDGIRFEIAAASDSDKITVDLLCLPSVANALDIKSNDVAQLPLYLYARTNAGRERLKTTLDYRLSTQPNQYTNAFAFWKTVAMQSMVGECFIACRGGELKTLPFGYAVRYVTPGGEVRYASLYAPEQVKAMGAKSGQQIIQDDYAYNEVLHLYESQDENGRPIPLRVRFAAILGLGSSLAAYSANLFNRGGVLAGYLSTDATIPDDKKKSNITGFKSLFKNAAASSGTGTDLKIAALDGGMKFNALNLSPQEMMLAEHRKDFRADVADMLHMPPWKLGLLESYKYASAEQAGRDYLQQSLNPLLVQIEREVNAKLIGDFERNDVYAEFSRDKAIAIDSKTMAEIDDLAVKNGGMSIDEWRSRRNLPAVAGGSMRQVPVNVTSAAYIEAAEAIKLEGLKLDNAIKAADLAAKTATPPQDTPPAAPDGPDAQDMADVQAEMLASLGEKITDAETMTALVAQASAKVAGLYGVDAAALAKFGETYLASALKRSESGANAKYEVNRVLNAFSHEALRGRHGTAGKIRWVGGTFDGQTKTLGETWQGSLRHPPLSESESDCFILPAA